jgi:predicted dehydrogenase
MILAKACHDLDVVQWLIDRPCKKVSSFGKLTYFTEKNAPNGAPVRCADGTCPNKDICTYNCHTIYVAPEGRMTTFWKGFYRDIVKTHLDFTDEEVMETLRHNEYGLCVFHANNDVVDHQVVNMEFEGGANAAITVNAFNGGGRYIRIFGTKGELFAHMSDKEIYVRTFEPIGKEMVPVTEIEESIAGGHGGGDVGIVYDLYDYLNGTYTGFSVADIHISVANHMIAFAAEKSRHNDTVVLMDDFCKEYDFKV